MNSGATSETRAFPTNTTRSSPSWSFIGPTPIIFKVMELTEQMVSYACQKVNGSMKITYQGANWTSPPPGAGCRCVTASWKPAGSTLPNTPLPQSLFKAIAAKGKTPNPQATRGKLIDFLLSEYLEPTLIQPTFLYDYPRDISPLAKSNPDDPLTVERFEGYVAGFELCNAFTELNDPLDQEQRFHRNGPRLH